MKFSYKFSNLLGTVYREGDLLFSPDGNSVISPVGNRISIFDLKSNKSKTLPVESRYNYTALDLSPNGCTLIAINEEGEAHMISLISQTIVHRYQFKQRVSAVKFSPDGKHFAVCKDNNVFVFKAPGPFSGEYNAFVMERVFHAAFDETTCLDWSSDSKVLAMGSKDMTVRLYPLEKTENFKSYSLSSHTDCIVACFFEKNSLDITTLARNGHTCVWECSKNIDELSPWQPTASPPKKKRKKERKLSDDSEDDAIDPTKGLEQSDDAIAKALEHVQINDEEKKEKEKDTLFYRRLSIHYLADEVRKDNREAVLSSAAYHKDTKILVTGFSTGAFFIHEMPEVNLIHSLSISEQSISSVSLNATGDWIALGCGGLGQLLVWEWQSETYVMKQQGHSNNMSCVAYSMDGQTIATGGEDGKVKLWNAHSGFCFVTFSEHASAVSALCFGGSKKIVISCSLDGTVRCYDVVRYRNFRTLTTPQPVQLACVAADSTGEFIAAGGQDVFEIFLWSVKFGRLLEILSGHEGPVWSVAFSPNVASSTLASVSWDKTLRIWDAVEKASAHETIELTADGICVVFNPDGQQVAVSTLDGQITMFDVRSGTQVHSIEGRNDLGSGRLDSDLVTAKQTLKAKSYTSLCYSADGHCILAGGQSKNVCIYNVQEGIILKRIEITQNRSFGAVDDFINRRKLTEFGNVALVEEREEREGGKVALKLPGVKKGDMASRTVKPEVRVFSLQFSPTGQEWTAATTEGLLIYSLNMGNVFDPWDLQMNITPAAVKRSIAENDHANALMMALKLNEAIYITEAIETTPVKDVDLIVSNLSEKYVEKLLVVIASAIDNSTHLEFYVAWIVSLLNAHGPQIKKTRTNRPAVLSMLKSLIKKYESLCNICDFNKYTMQYTLRLADFAAKKEKLDESAEAGTVDEDVEMEE